MKATLNFLAAWVLALVPAYGYAQAYTYAELDWAAAYIEPSDYLTVEFEVIDGSTYPVRHNQVKSYDALANPVYSENNHDEQLIYGDPEHRYGEAAVNEQKSHALARNDSHGLMVATAWSQGRITLTGGGYVALYVPYRMIRQGPEILPFGNNWGAVVGISTIDQNGLPRSSSAQLMQDGDQSGLLRLIIEQDYYGPRSYAVYGDISAAAPIPEPETYALLLVGLGVMNAVARRRRWGRS